MNTTITLGEFIIIAVGSILVYAFVKAVIDTIKEKFNAQFVNRYGGPSRDAEGTGINIFKLNHYQ